MRADVRTIEDLFSSSKELTTPFFQRPYRWSETENWRLFWEHWAALIRAEAEGARGGRVNFLGAVVLQEGFGAPLAANAPPLFDGPQILDGQQRLLTASVALHALALHASAHGAAELAGRIRALTHAASGAPRVTPSWPSVADFGAALAIETLSAAEAPETAAYFEADPGAEPETGDDDPPDAGFDDDAAEIAALEAGGAALFHTAPEEGADEPGSEADAPAADGVDRLQGALRYFHARIEHALRRAAAEGMAPAPALERLFDALARRSILVEIVLDDTVNPFEVFERLNDLGERLSSLDLLKNHLFFVAGGDGGGRSLEALQNLYMRHWTIFDDPAKVEFWGGVERRGAKKLPVQEWFLRAYASVRLRDSTSAARSYSEVRDIVAASRGDGAKEIADVCRAARAYAELGGGAAPERHGERIEALRLLREPAFDPLLIAIRLHLWPNEAATEAVLAMLESILVRRFFTRRPLMGAERLLARLTRLVGPGCAEHGQEVARKLREALLGAQGGAFWPKTGLFKRAFAKLPLVNRSGAALARDSRALFRYVFAELDAAARGDEPAAAELSRDDLTIEHFYPLLGRRHWPAPAEHEKSALQSIGNLTIVTQAVNLLMGQNPWPQKLEALRDGSRSYLNRAVVAHPDWSARWGVAQIRQRGEMLAALAAARWPRP